MEDEIKKALDNNQIEKVDELLQASQLAKLPIDFVPEEATVLHVASMLGYADCVRLSLLCSNVNVNAQDAMRWTPIMHAVANNHRCCVEHFVRHRQCNLTLQDKYQQTVLHIHSQTTDADPKVADLLLSRIIMLDVEDSMGMTVFLYAVEAGNLSLAQALFSRGCNIHTYSNAGQTALHIAARLCDEQMVSWLLTVGCNVNILDNQIQTPMMSCVQEKRDSHQVFRVMRLLIEAGANVNQQDYHGNTALLLAMSNPGVIRRHHIELLMSAGSDTNLHNRSCLTPIWQAVYDGSQYPDRLHVIQILLRDNCYLDMACRGKLLFTSGLDTVYCYENFMSPLEVAMDSGFHDAAKMLLVAGCQIKPDLRLISKDVCGDLQWFQNVLDTPRTLHHQCRLVIRKVLGQTIQTKVRKLPLPERVKEYLLFQDTFLGRSVMC